VRSLLVSSSFLFPFFFIHFTCLSKGKKGDGVFVTVLSACPPPLGFPFFSLSLHFLSSLPSSRRLNKEWFRFLFSTTLTSKKFRIGLFYSFPPSFWLDADSLFFIDLI